MFIVAGGNPRPPALNDSPDFKGSQILKHILESLGFVINSFFFSFAGHRFCGNHR